jgi:hypothetical protein
MLGVLNVSNKFQNLILSLDMLHQDLYYLNKDTNNPQIKKRLKYIREQISILMNDLEKPSSFDQSNTTLNNKSNNSNKIPKIKAQPKKKKHKKQPKLFEGAKGRNSYRSSSLFNEQGGFKPSKPSYKAGYLD